MKFPLAQLHSTNKSKPMVEVVGVEGELQWDYCDLEGLPGEIVPGTKTMHHMGVIPKGQWDNLPEKFTATDGKEYKIDDISSIRSSNYKTYKHKDVRDESNWLGFDGGGEG
jgi:hypothetical protein